MNRSGRAISPQCILSDYYSNTVNYVSKNSDLKPQNRDQSGDKDKDPKNTNSSSGPLNIPKYQQEHRTIAVNTVSESFNLFDYSRFSKENHN